MSASEGEVSTIGEVLDLWLSARVATLRVSMPGKVLSFDPAKGTASVKPLLMEETEGQSGERVVESLPVLPEVPVLIPSGGNFRGTFPVLPGDEVELVFADRALEKWKRAGGEVDPVDLRRHHLADAVAIPGLRPSQRAWTDWRQDACTFGRDGGLQVHVSDTIIGLGEASPADAVALANQVLARLNELKAVFQAWTPVAGDGGAVLKAAMTLLFDVAGWPGSVGSASVKCKP